MIMLHEWRYFSVGVIVANVWRGPMQAAAGKRLEKDRAPVEAIVVFTIGKSLNWVRLNDRSLACYMGRASSLARWECMAQRYIAVDEEPLSRCPTRAATGGLW